MANLSRLTRYLSVPPQIWLLPLSLFLLFFPLLPLPAHFMLYDAQRIGLLLVALATVVILAFSPRLWNSWIDLLATLPRRAAALLLLFLLLGIASSLRARIPGEAFLELAQWVLLFMLSSIIAATVRFRNTDTTMFIFCLIGTAVAAYLLDTVLPAYLNLLITLHTPSADIVQDFSNPRFFNQFQTWTFPALVSLATLSSKRWRLVTLLLLGSWWALLFVTVGRGALLGQLVAAVGILLLFRKHAIDWLRQLGLGVLLGTVLYLLLFKLIPALLGTIPSQLGAASPSLVNQLTAHLAGGDGRFRVWSRAWEMFGHAPWLGAGPMHFACYINEPMDPAHPHNIVLQLLAEWGGPATLIAILLLILGLIRWFRTVDIVASFSPGTRDLTLHLGISATLLAALTHAMVSGLLTTPMSMTMFTLFLGLSWGNASVRMTPGKSATTTGGVLGLASLGAILWIATVLQQQIPLLPDSYAAYHYSHPGIRQGPRFWLQGFICY